ncbi:hypothetical protein SDC9_141312 [bioreactor metagenome]|uniref:Uncharacterized protein n=1 Tax=bioreactor metagenome TaxID=1076179 RepID=A0A645DXR1_9ZZZZ
MRWAILAKSNTVMSENKYRSDTHQSCHSNSRAHEIRKYQERAAIRNKSSVQGHTIDDFTHSMFTDTKMNISSRTIFRREEAASFDISFIRRAKVSGTTS